MLTSLPDRRSILVNSHNMLVIRLSRVGKKKQPTYRLVLQEQHRDPWGTSIEILGNYNPRTEPITLSLKEERVQHWLDRGAQPSPTVHNLLVNAGIIKDKKVRATTHDKQEIIPGADSKESPKEEAAEKTDENQKAATDTPEQEEKPAEPATTEQQEDKQ